MEDRFIGQHSLLNVENKSIFLKARAESNYSFDYELNDVEVFEDKGTKELRLLDKETKRDSLEVDPDGNAKKKINKIQKANCFKRLVSKKKHRIENEYFDLDMAFITQRVIAMGYPSTGCESLYRNKLEDLMNFFARYQPNYKIYNLCIEDGRIYPKNLFTVTKENGKTERKKVGLFPFLDHQPCPIKLMLEITTDMCLHLIRNPNSIVALHCKAGKGRTGMMIVCYLIFSGLCATVEEALSHYAKQRTKNNKGVTIPSQKRYIEYFNAFCLSHFSWPYYKCIPLIKARFLSDSIYNILRDYLNKTDYFYTRNTFHFKSVRIGPFKSRKDGKIEFSSLNSKKMGFEKCPVSINQEGNGYIMTIDVSNGPSFNYDVKLTFSAFMFQFYCWFNLYYSTIENLTNHISNILKLQKPQKSGKLRGSIIALQESISESIVPKNETKDEKEEEEEKESNKGIPLLEEEIIDTSSSKNNLVNETTSDLNNSNTMGNENLSSILNDTQSSQSSIEGNRKTTINLRKSLLHTLKNMNESFKDEQDLNQMIKLYNEEAVNLGIPKFVCTNQKMIINQNKLDKFRDKLKIVDKNDFRVEVTFDLEETSKEYIFGQI